MSSIIEGYNYAIFITHCQKESKSRFPIDYPIVTNSKFAVTIQQIIISFLKIK